MSKIIITQGNLRELSGDHMKTAKFAAQYSQNNGRSWQTCAMGMSALDVLRHAEKMNVQASQDLAMGVNPLRMRWVEL